MLNDQNVYLDNNSTTKTDPRVLKAMLPYFTEVYANANSSHIEGLSVKDAVENAVWRIADLIGAQENEIIFTSGATEALNLAIKGIVPYSTIFFIFYNNSPNLPTLQFFWYSLLYLS